MASAQYDPTDLIAAIKTAANRLPPPKADRELTTQSLPPPPTAPARSSKRIRGTGIAADPPVAAPHAARIPAGTRCAGFGGSRRTRLGRQRAPHDGSCGKKKPARMARIRSLRAPASRPAPLTVSAAPLSGPYSPHPAATARMLLAMTEPCRPPKRSPGFRPHPFAPAGSVVTDLAPPRLRRPASGTSRQGNAPDAFGLPPDLRPTPSPLARRGCG